MRQLRAYHKGIVGTIKYTKDNIPHTWPITTDEKWLSESDTFILSPLATQTIQPIKNRWNPPRICATTAQKCGNPNTKKRRRNYPTTLLYRQSQLCQPVFLHFFLDRTCSIFSNNSVIRTDPALDRLASTALPCSIAFCRAPGPVKHLPLSPHVQPEPLFLSAMMDFPLIENI